MADLVGFLRDCAASGTLLGSVCGLAIVPFLAWVGTRALAPTILGMREEPAWQAPVAAIAGALPGAVFLSLAIIGLIGATSSGCLSYAWGRMFFAAIIVAVAIALSRATVLAHRRTREVQGLIDASLAPDAALDILAKGCGIRVRVLTSPLPFCALAGIWSPIVLLSSGSVDRLTRNQLIAALHHERAHATRLDLVSAAALSFFVDLLPLPVDDLVSVYGNAREIAADERALLTCEADMLASAILALATPRAILATASLAQETHVLHNRIERVLNADPGRVVSRRRRTVAVASLLGIAGVSFLPVVLSAANFYVCISKGMNV